MSSVISWRFRPFHRPAPSKPLTAFGQTLTISQWSKRTGIPNRTILDRLQRGWSVERALLEKVKP
jgi:hypothetical protein